LQSSANHQNSFLSTSGKKLRDKSIIDVLMFGNGHVTHHPSTIKWFWKVLTSWITIWKVQRLSQLASPASLKQS